MAQAVRTALRLVSGAYGAISFDELQPGTLVNDEFGRFFGIVVECYATPNVVFVASDIDNLMVVVQIDPSHPGYGTWGDQAAISGRYLEPIPHGPLAQHTRTCAYRGEPMQPPRHCCQHRPDTLAGYRLLAKLINPHAETTWAERNRP